MRSLVILLACPLFAAVTITPSSLTFTQRESGTRDWGQQVTVNGAGEAWSFGVPTGTLGALNVAVIQYSSASGTAPTAGVWIAPLGNVTDSAAATTYTGNLPIVVSGSTVANLAITLVIVARRPYPPYLNGFGIADSALPLCHNSNAYYPDLDTCDPLSPVVRPSGTFNLPSTAGASYVDSTFGRTVTAISGASPDGYISFYASQPPVNVEGTMVAGSSVAFGNKFIFSASGAGTLVTAPPIGSQEVFWSPVRANTYYTFSGKNIIRVAVTPPTTTSTTVYTWAGSAANLDSGGTTGMSKDGWMIFRDMTDGKVCIINPEAVTPVAYCGLYTSVLPDPGMDFVKLLPGIDPRTSKRYIVVAGGTYNQIWTYSAGDVALTFDRRMPARPESKNTGWSYPCTSAKAAAGGCMASGHGEGFETSDGHQYWIAVIGDSADVFRSDIVALDMTTGDLMTTYAEAGGGMYLMYKASAGGLTHHSGAALLAPVLLVSRFWYGTTDGTIYQPNHLATAASNTSPIVLTMPTLTAPTTFTGAPFVSTDKLLCSGFHGNTGANGTWNNVTVSGTSVTLPGSVGTGAWTFAGGCVLNSTAFQYPHQEVVAIVGLSERIYRVWATRGPGYAVASPYYSSPRCGPNMQGTQAICNSSGGYPSEYSMAIFSIPTGYGPTSGSVRRSNSVRRGGSIRR